MAVDAPRRTKKKGPRWYAVARGVKPRVYATWAEAEQQVKGYKDAQHLSFETEAEASTWFAKNKQNESTAQSGDDIAE